jgi:hypothetical protein
MLCPEPAVKRICGLLRPTGATLACSGEVSSMLIDSAKPWLARSVTRRWGFFEQGFDACGETKALIAAL